MRRVGTLPKTDNVQQNAQRFVDYLVTLSIDASTNADADGDWDIWVRDEERIGEAKSLFSDFAEDPSNEKYSVSGEANRIREEKIQANRRRLEKQRKNEQKLSRGRNPMTGFGAVGGVQQRIPVTIGVIALSILLSLFTKMGRDLDNPISKTGELKSSVKVFNTLAFVDDIQYFKTNDPYASIKEGEVWRLVSPFFVHLSPMHLVFNMLATFVLGSVIERLHGSWRYLLIILVTGLAGMIVQVSLPDEESLPRFLQSLSGSPFAMGFSGVCYGLFGFLWVRPTIDPSYPIRIPSQSVFIMMGWFFACIFVFDGIANGGHIGGLVAGILIAALIPRHFLSNSA